ncbi:amino acid ABC transporter ATP-binding protein [Gymnodinialimonas phycosphaerae]|uniref:amino acid ABC transporter ATP-binding protein n=1 Tax=Gymnodinialimonas phycosphaerae TaxID=2841589 RepID=UPI00249E9044|nr:amino acid ABC transporter ATP-binding protein [Gymnodinialimonas phycosphaerae]
MNDQQVIIEATHLDKFYGDFHALKDINLSVHQGEKMVVCGPSGSGKSTLIRCFNGLEFHNSGTLVIDGIEVHENAKEIRQLRQNVGMVFQQFNLFPHLTVLENLTIGPMKVRGLSTSDAEATARKYLDRVHIPEQADKYPSALSGGQQQRVAIARSLCMETKIMLFDEPTSALDPEMINEVLDVMAELVDTGMTMVVVTHEMGFARKVADTMVFMEEGRIIETSPPEQFFTNPSSERCRMFLDQILAH